MVIYTLLGQGGVGQCHVQVSLIQSFPAYEPEKTRGDSRRYLKWQKEGIKDGKIEIFMVNPSNSANRLGE